MKILNRYTRLISRVKKHPWWSVLAVILSLVVTFAAFSNDISDLYLKIWPANPIQETSAHATDTGSDINIQDSLLNDSPVFNNSSDNTVNYYKNNFPPRQLDDVFKTNLNKSLAQYEGYILEISYAFNDYEARNFAEQIYAYLIEEGWNVKPEIAPSVYTTDGRPSHLVFDTSIEGVLTMIVQPLK